MTDDELLVFLQEAKSSSIAYREKFRGTWEEIEGQLRCVHPDSWSEKEDWQTKVYIPQQAKKSEVANSYLNKMVFGRGSNFDIRGVEIDDRDQAKDLVKLISTLMGDSFAFENIFVMNEGIDQGTSFIKVLINSTRDGFIFAWRSVFEIGIDPKAGHRFEKGRWIIDFMEKDLGWILAEQKKDNSIYDKEVIKKFFADAAREGESMSKTRNPTSSGPNDDGFVIVKSIDGTTDLKIPSKYVPLKLDEFWISVPNEDGVYEERLISLLNDKWILRNDINEYGFKPFRWCRVKPRKYDAYGKGYMENTRGLQDLANSCINLGFDSLKISAMDILLVDMQKVKDPSSIKYKPLAVWKMKDINGAKINRSGISSINDILNGLTLIDQIDQDASGVTRQVQAAPNLGKGGGGEETLGEFERKLQLIDQRFLDVGRFIERDYFTPLIRMIFKIIVNPKLFTQKAVDDILGFDEVDLVETVDGESKVTGKQFVPRLDLKQLREKQDMADHFRAIGITQFTEKLETIAKLRQVLQDALQNETLTIMTKIDELWKKLLQASDVEDHEFLLRSKDEIEELLNEQPVQQ